MLSLAVLICALLGANAEIPTWDASCVGCPLKSLADHKVESADGFLATTLTVDVITLKTPNTTFKTRAYNGALGGPRLVLQAGDKVELTLVNNLEDRDNTGEWNQPRKPNTTNLHLHGMHVSGRAPGDDIRLIVPPRGHYSYSYEIPEDHMPGHHWYHPHHHGGTALQNSGGMYGSIEVNDPEFKQPPEIEALPLEYIEILNMPFSAEPDFWPSFDLEATQSTFNKALLQTKPEYESRELLLVNGGSQPVIAMEKNQWYRFRIGYFSSYHNLWTVIKDAQDWMPGANGSKCEWRLMAHDGNYLDELPRKFGMLPLTQAARAEIVMRCTEPGSYTWEAIEFGSTAYGLTDDDWAAMFGQGPNATAYPWYDARVQIDSLAATIATFEVSDSAVVAEDLPVYALNRPCYVASTLDEDEALMTERSLKFSMPSSDKQPNAPPLFYINGAEYARAGANAHTFEVPVGGVVEYTYGGAEYHSAHIHINPVQLVTATTDAGEALLKTHGENPFAGFSLEGDWFDTLILGTPVLKTRQLVDRWTGPMVVHCHILIHEDYGMMSTIEVTGEEGTRCLAQQDVIYGCDVCYTGATGGRGYCYKNNTPGAETMAPTPAKESDGAAATLVGGVAAAIAVVALL